MTSRDDDHNSPKTALIQLTETLSAARFWRSVNHMMTGWIRVTNLSPYDMVRVHHEEGSNEDEPYEELPPLATQAWQCGFGKLMYFSAGTSGTRLKIIWSKWKPSMPHVLIDHAAEMVVNLPFAANNVALTTTYDLTTLAKGYGTYVQVASAVGGFNGTVELSADEGVTWSSPINLDNADPMTTAFEENKVLTTVRVTVVAGQFHIYYR